MSKRTEPATILYVHSSADLYGSDRCLLDLVRNLDRDRFRPMVVLPYRGMLSEEFERAGVRVIHSDPWVLRKVLFRTKKFHGYFMSLPSNVKAIMRVIKEEKVSLVHSNTGVVLGGALAAKLCGIPHIWHLREFFSDFPFLWYFYSHFMGILSGKIICISEAVASQLPDLVRAKAVVVHDGIETKRFGTLDDQEAQASLRQELGLGEGTMIVGAIGRVSEIKAQDIFIRAIPDVLSAFPRTKFLIVGGIFPGHEPFMKRIRALVENLGLNSHVIFTGFRRDAAAMVRLMDIVVQATRIPEGLGISLIEAMSAGKAVIAAGGGGSDEVVEDGKTGLLIPPGDFRALSGAIIRLLSSDPLRERMGNEGRRRAAETFSLERTISLIQQIYDVILNSSSIPLPIGERGG